MTLPSGTAATATLPLRSTSPKSSAPPRVVQRRVLPVPAMAKSPVHAASAAAPSWLPRRGHHAFPTVHHGFQLCKEPVLRAPGAPGAGRVRSVVLEDPDRGAAHEGLDVVVA